MSWIRQTITTTDGAVVVHEGPEGGRVGTAGLDAIAHYRFERLGMR